MESSVKCFDVKDFNWPELASILSSNFLDSKGVSFSFFDRSKLENHRPVSYLYSILQKYDCKSVVLEKEYLSFSFLEDFKNYYVDCFNPIAKNCKRLHFFSKKINATSFEELDDILLSDNDYSDIGYLGYTVLKPTPNAIIGPTLIPYKNTQDSIHIPDILCDREYIINLFGKSMRVSTLVTQEQDKLTSVCATVSIFTALHILSSKFRIPTPSTSTISEIVGISHSKSNRVYRNKTGLTPKSMAHIFSYYGFDTITESLNSMNYSLEKRHGFVQFLYAYAKSKLPVILSLDLSNGQKKSFHSVVIIGFLNTIVESRKSVGLNLISDFIESIIVHDEGTGPNFELRVINQKSGTLEGDFLKRDNSLNKKKYQLSTSIIPIPKYLKVNHTDIVEVITPINRIIRTLFNKSYSESKELIWDIYLNQNIDFKKKQLALKKQCNLDVDESHYRSYPRYVWVADCFIERKPFLSFIFDSTIPNYTDPILERIFYDKLLFKDLLNIFESIQDTFTKQDQKIFKNMIRFDLTS